MRNIALIVSYDGTSYHGWQCQPNLRTIEQTLKEGIERIVNHPIKMYSGARTDRGVHAYGQVVSFLTESRVARKGLILGLNSLLPQDIRVIDAVDKDMDFNARYSAKSKLYIYTILNTPYDSPFYTRYTWHIPYPMDTPSMNRAIRYILGAHDFSSFKKKDEVYKSHIREILMAGVKRRGPFIHIFVEGTGFMRYMVRNIVGTITYVGFGKISEADFLSILNAKDRDAAGPTAPAKGLALRRITY
ncbi:MAG: tRNA pseudouridine(38-40) synthase TruA [Syntrophorhabdaceae bacterium]|nr:tRNA pseudouridine(38-40) synthase TruA [Syntrophorhabdaceae bacterium]